MTDQLATKKVIAFSLWGKKKVYCYGAIRNAELVPIVYPGWIARFYVGSSVPMEVCQILSSFPHVELVHQEEEGDWTGSLWRFLAAGDPEVSIMISRDADGRLSDREKVAVDAWLASDRPFHTMRDHPAHNIPILAGMWGVKAPYLREMADLIQQYQKRTDYYSVDQCFLTDVIYPRVHQQWLEHDRRVPSKNFPTPIFADRYIGISAWDYGEFANLEHNYPQLINICIK